MFGALHPDEIDGYFRREYGRCVATLVRFFGDIDLAEDARVVLAEAIVFGRSGMGETVDDGQIAAANALSDIYAMGAEPVSAERARPEALRVHLKHEIDTLAPLLIKAGAQVN